MLLFRFLLFLLLDLDLWLFTFFNILFFLLSFIFLYFLHLSLLQLLLFLFVFVLLLQFLTCLFVCSIEVPKMTSILLLLLDSMEPIVHVVLCHFYRVPDVFVVRFFEEQFRLMVVALHSNGHVG